MRIAPLGHHHHGGVEHDERRHRERREVLEPHARDEQHHARPSAPGEAAVPRSGWIRIRKANHDQQQQRGEQSDEIVDALGAPFDVVGEEQDDRELGELGGLEATSAPEPDPAVRVVHRPA